MATSDESRVRLELDAEILMVYHFDLLAQVELQLRAVHHTMRHIEKLRSAKHRVGPELSNDQHGNTLAALDTEIEALDSQLTIERDCCIEMHDTITTMQARLEKLRQIVSGDQQQ